MRSRENTTPTRASHRGFTLVELLVVITIIGILAGLALVGIQGAVVTVQNTAIKLEISQIGQALDLYKTDRGSYPPDGSNLITGTARATAISRHLNKLYPQRISDDYPAFDATIITRLQNDGYLSPNASITVTTFDALDPTETYVLFLMGFSADIERPLTGAGERTPLFEFDETRLIDEDGDGWWAYRPDYSDSEIVYFNAKNYATRDTSGNVTAISTVDCTGSTTLADGVARPYGTINTNGDADWVNDDTYQLMVAGRDGDFGNDYSTATTVKLYPSGIANSSVSSSIDYTLEDFDNITNFTEGSTLEADEDLE